MESFFAVSESGFVYRVVGAEADITATRAPGRWAIVAAGNVVQIMENDPAGFMPEWIYRDVSNRPEIDVGWTEVDGDFIPPATPQF